MNKLKRGNSYINFDVDLQTITGEFEHDWRFIGYDECNYTYMPQGIELLKKFSSLNDGKYHIRTHFIFCTGNRNAVRKFGSTNIYREDKQGNPIYDYSYIDAIFDAIVDSGCAPFIELGFTPFDLVDQSYVRLPEGKKFDQGNYVNDSGWSLPPKDYTKWADLVENFTSHLIQRYGSEVVSTWYFELWNEPDWGYFKGTVQDFCKLFDYTEEALHRVLPKAKLGGPAVTGGPEGADYLDKFLMHIKSGTNYCTNAIGTRVDFITFHIKGNVMWFPFDLDPPYGNPTVDRLIELLNLMLDVMKKHGVTDKEVVLTEADPDGWAAGGMHDNINHVFRNTEYYASYVAAAYHQIATIAKELNMKIRPLAWAFMFPDERCFEGTRTFSTQGIDKAIFNLFRMYSKLGDKSLAITTDSIVQDDQKTWFGAYAVQGKNNETHILSYSHNDDRDLVGENTITLTLEAIENEIEFVVEHFRIDEIHSNAYHEWCQQGSPNFPNPEQYEAIKRREGLEKINDDYIVISTNNKIQISLTMSLHAVSLVTLRKRENK
jgi:xylan 1,4-beta-xylosidase